jgi:dTDP-4-dehydrorhamnose reductase
MKTVLITGANGLLGQNCTKVFGALYRLFLTDIQEHPSSGVSGTIEYISADITDKNLTDKLLDKTAPDIIVHAAAMTDVDGCEVKPDLAEHINVTGTQNLIQGLPASCRFVNISTDYIFDGENGPYSEEATPNPISVYGRTKLEAELLVKNQLINYQIIRTIVLYGAGNNLRPFFTDWVLGKLSRKERIRVVDDQIGNATLASNLASLIKTVLENGVAGTYHASGSDILSRFEFARKIADWFGYDKTLISACKTEEINQKAPRPLNSGFILDKIKQVHGVKLLDTDQQLVRYKGERQKALSR